MGKRIVNVEVAPQAATEPGALDGWVVLCSECGESGRSSLTAPESFATAGSPSRGHLPATRIWSRCGKTRDQQKEQVPADGMYMFVGPTKDQYHE
jgi:hypothetical protein